MIYFDNSATTPMHPNVLEEMMPYLTEFYGNPSSVYKFGQKSRFAIDQARRIISSYINVSPQEIVFTAGGTESINLAIKGTAEALSFSKSINEINIVTSKIEHSAVLASVKHLERLGYKVHLIDVDKHGNIDLKDLDNKLSQMSGSIIATFQYANSEIGTVQDIKKISKLIKDKGGIVHVDAMQAIRYFDIDVDEIGCDMMTFAPHKFNGPKGIGALYIKKGTPIVRQSDGGQQEYYLRAGTENVAGIVGFGKAVEILTLDKELNIEKVKKLREYFEEKLKMCLGDQIEFNSLAENKLPSISSVLFKNLPADQVLVKLDFYDICVSAGSACNSGSVQISPVLAEIVSEEEARSTVRFSFGPENTYTEIDEAIVTITKILEEMKSE